MEDILQFLFVAGVIIFGFIKQSQKESSSSKQTEDDFDMPLSEEMPVSDISPIDSVCKPKPNKHTAPKIPRSTASSAPVEKPSQTEDTKNTPDYGIHSIEEVRRAIIWSEILQRKY